MRTRDEERNESMDKKTITDALKHCADETPAYCRWCPCYKGTAQCISALMRDALALIETLEEKRKAEVRNEHKFEKGDMWILNEEKQTEGH